MKVIQNDKLIARNSKIGKTVTYVALGVLAIGFLISIFRAEMLFWAYVALLIGFMLSQIGINLTSQWGQSPRPDEKITKALKGLPGDYTLYHFMTPASHLLIGPAGIWILSAFYQRGTILYDEGAHRWKQKNVSTFLKIFAQEGIGHPDSVAKGEAKELEKFLNKEFPDVDLPPVQTAMVFTHEDVEVDAEGAPYPTMAAKKLKDFMRKAAKENPADMEKIQILQKALPSE